MPLWPLWTTKRLTLLCSFITMPGTKGKEEATKAKKSKAAVEVHYHYLFSDLLLLLFLCPRVILYVSCNSAHLPIYPLLRLSLGSRFHLIFDFSSDIAH